MSISLLIEMEMLTQTGHWSWKMSIINYLFYLSVIYIIVLLAADCPPSFISCFKAPNNFFNILFSLSFSPFSYCRFRLMLLVSELACSLLLFPQYCLSPISERCPFWSLKCLLKSHFSSRSTNFNRLLNNKIWSKAHWSQWEPVH